MSKDVQDKQQHGGNFVNGFMWGAVVGGGISFVLSHKKGRELLKDLSENGVEALRGVLDPDNIDELKKGFKEHMQREEEYEYRERGRYSPPTPSARSTAPKKRVFKGIKKK